MLMKTTSEILLLLKQYKPIASSKYGLTRLGIFGSVARGQQTEDSDVDVCYEGKAPSFITLDHIQSDLEHLFGSKVDLVRVRENMNAMLKQRIQREGIYV
jgi:predicted nucleotidyltransferase